MNRCFAAAARNFAAGRPARTFIAGRHARTFAAGRDARTFTAGRHARTFTAGRYARNFAAGRYARNFAAGRYARNFAAGRYARSVARAGLAGAATLAVSIAAAGPASAEPINGGTVGGYTSATCGWHPVTASLSDLWDAKVVRVNLPSVSGVTADQLVVARVLFTHPDGAGGLTEYRSGTFYSFASPGRMTTSWTSTIDYTSGWTTVEDAPGESGYTAGDTQNLDTIALVYLYWADGDHFNGYALDIAINAGSVLAPAICNTGGTLT